MDQKVTLKSKHRGLSPFGNKHRGNSPFQRRSKSPNQSSRGESPFRLRGLSPFRRRGSASSNDSSDGGGSRHHHRKTHNILVCHENARSIVFRDHLRHVTKIVEEEDLDADLDSDSDNGNDDDDDDDPDLSQKMRQSIKDSLRQSLRDSLRGANPPITKEINLLAQSLVPELVNDVSKMHVVSDRDVQIEKLHVHMTPLPQFDLGPRSKFEDIIMDPTANNSNDSNNVCEALPSMEGWTLAEKQVYSMMREERACVKTIKNSDWGTFLNRFLKPHPRGSNGHRRPNSHDDIGPKDDVPYNSFFTSATLLPESGKKMRCYGSLNAHTAGVIFALPQFATPQEEEEEATRTETWCWPAGYSAKTEFNIDERGRLINGRQEALVSFHQLRQYNHEYLHAKDHTIAGKVIKGGFSVVPFNEVYLRVGGCDRFGRLGKDCVRQASLDPHENQARSLEHGVGLPIALFIRDNTIGDILTLFRVRGRLTSILGEVQAYELPLFLISSDCGIRVFTKDLQCKFWKMVATAVNPFQNPILEPLTQMDNTKDSCLQQKFEELIDLDANVRQTLTCEECATIAGGFGTTDKTTLQIFQDALARDKDRKTIFSPEQSTHIQSTIAAGLSSAVRCGDYYTARQLLIIYSYVTSSSGAMHGSSNNVLFDEPAFSFSDLSMLDKDYKGIEPTYPPLIDTERLRGATNSDGLLSVLGGAQVLNALKDGSAIKKTEDSFRAVEEWVKYGEQSVTFRVASWRDLRAAEGETHIAVDDNAKFMAFVSNKAITNRKKFAQQLRQAADRKKNKNGLRFLCTIYGIVKSMHSPCLRLELLQYILGLDNRYSVAQVKRSIELAATCLSVRH